LDYSSPQVKEAALKNLQEKIDQMKEQIDSLKKRIENYKEEICPICYDDFNNALITSCCSRVFCALCILQSLSRNPTCPMCRAAINPQSLKKISISEEENTVVSSEVDLGIKKKIDTFFDILKENPQGKFLVFSRFDNSFLEIMEKCRLENLTAKELKGSKDTIASLLEQFKKGSINILCLNTLEMGAGLNITEATHVILLHSMTHEEEKQILGRAYRVGLDKELHFIKLVYPDETN
jgi:SNF2 family DNA or RNA helicase